MYIRAMLTVLTLLTVLTVGAGMPRPWIGIQGEWVLSPQADFAKWQWLAEADATGVTEITVTAIGGDLPDIDVRFLSRTEREGWTEFKDAANRLGITPVVYLSEWEHRGILTDNDRLDVARWCVATFGQDGWIACIGEEFNAGTATALRVAGEIRALAPGIPIAIHNPHYGPPRVEFETIILPALMAAGMVDIWLIQDTLEDMPATYARAEAMGLIAVAHEQAPADWGTQPLGISEWFENGRAASIYPGYKNPDCTDLWCPQPGIYAQPLAQLGRERFLRHAGTGGDFNGDGRIDAADFWR
jgi:hypothetical protein